MKAIQRNLNFNDLNAAIKQVDDLISCIKLTGGCGPTNQANQTANEENEPNHIISVSEATSLDAGIHKIEGVISAIWPKQKLIEKIGHRCVNCNILNEGYATGRLSNGKPTIFQIVKSPKKCTNCGKNHLVEDKTHTTYTNAAQVELRNPDTYSEIDPLKVVVFDKDAEEIVHHVGEKVIITGLIHIELVFNKWKRFPYLYAKSIKYESKEKLVLKDSDIEVIRALVREKGNNIINYLGENYFAPKVIGYNDVKKGLLLCAASTNLDTNRKKLNAALLGDPGTAKSLLLQEETKLVANSTVVSAQSSSAISLTAIVETEKDSHVLRLGPIPLSRGGICALNEGGGMSFGHQKYLLDVMQEQKFKFSKHGITTLVSSPTSIIWSSNPTSGRWKNPDVIDLDEFPAIKPLIDRFDLIYSIRDNRDAEEERRYADKKFEMDDDDDDNDNKIFKYESNLVYLQKHIEYSKRFHPKLSEEAKFMLKEYYLGVRAKYGSRRVRESIVTIARMIAQLKLKDVIDAEDAKETQDIFNKVLEPLQKIVNTTTNPIEVVVEECLNILKESNNIEWKFYTDLIDRVCENPQAQRYIDNAHKKRNYDKLKPIIDRLLNHSHVKQTNRNPLTLAWITDREILQ
jgi:DNA replicative helicase MCM subunit Mcm2 (Cdc46/Mcm family)